MSSFIQIVNDFAMNLRRLESKDEYFCCNSKQGIVVLVLYLAKIVWSQIQFRRSGKESTKSFQRGLCCWLDCGELVGGSILLATGTGNHLGNGCSGKRPEILVYPRNTGQILSGDEGVASMLAHANTIESAEPGAEHYMAQCRENDTLLGRPSIRVSSPIYFH